MKPAVRNPAASHRAKLLALARDRGDDFQFLLGRWMIERFLFRLGVSSHKDRFVLKGAMLFLALGGRIDRPTRDLDLLGFGSAEVGDVVAAIAGICSVAANDGILFATASIEAERIREDAEYEGVRVWVPASLDGAKVTIQIDVGFGDDVEPAPVERPFPTLLPLDPPVVRAYPLEAVIAEKFQAMAVLGIANSRMKDFYDLWTLAAKEQFDIRQLARSIRATFQRRRTPLPETPPAALTDEFLLNPGKRRQWEAFGRRLGLRELPPLEIVGQQIREFLMPVLERASRPAGQILVWEPAGPWRQPES